MDIERERRIEAFLQSLTGVPWFSNAGRPSETYHVAADAEVAWDDWNAPMLEVWVTRSERLEARAQRAVGDAAIDATFTRVADVLESTVKAGVKAYFARRPDDTENTEVGADLGLWPDIVERVLRDMAPLKFVPAQSSAPLSSRCSHCLPPNR